MKRYFFGVLASGALVAAMMGMVYMYYKYPITLLIPVIAYTCLLYTSPSPRDCS